ncbi:Crp/Fnr family transcriptional regulator [Sediminitomix flava]|uniref:CRP-like cAMP-binding protein n=1 Tax=Sediminitomix flava TaxID=379075 RepID=A0A315ZF98_SEDFL|nr:Crp/Fnr family transcriptional regulator [Sediminitomix flava]PWJ44235.1 CRP-like cAMP-binding protein [Sediminitomix flava]
MKEALKEFVYNFEYLTKEEADLIIEKTNLQSFKKGTILLSEGEIAKNCYAVIQGLVREYYYIDGVDKTTAFYTEGQPVNSFSSATNQTPSKHYWECAEDCILTVGSDSLINEMCELIPRLKEFILLEVEKNTGELQDRFATFMTSSHEERFENLMATNPSLINRVPQYQIASYLGVTPESLSRIKKRLLKKA